MDGRARLVEIAKPYLRHVPVGIYRDLLEQRLAEKAQTSSSLLNKHLDKPTEKIIKNRSQSKINTTSISPIRLAITILLQYPELHLNIGDFNKIKTLELPGIKILIQILETLRDNPHLNTAALLERARGSDSAEHLQKLVLQSFSLSSSELQPELNGIIKQLQQQALEKRHEYLENKGLRNLTDAERVEYKANIAK